ncbi:hypothetical protein PC9H_002258 [Pleurotus ostreatus]|uniref:Uncharacterized protein n=1 Tax=Pleurotus ostreatus TaxID=5322 RepID=A0A8H6ZM81_PLEOS|nr:uncharacterized protein PC9H_002258 [Pleurotus ostreatus]KAF7419666.1 hypothetical protein PC9H_002258 [Pleurotus ostreatus]KAJ8689458.1 hypothetical protein PTI98_012360 [Pleurotus ostreatus]
MLLSELLAQRTITHIAAVVRRVHRTCPPPCLYSEAAIFAALGDMALNVLVAFAQSADILATPVTRRAAKLTLEPKLERIWREYDAFVRSDVGGCGGLGGFSWWILRIVPGKPRAKKAARVQWVFHALILLCALPAIRFEGVEPPISIQDLPPQPKCAQDHRVDFPLIHAAHSH